MSNSLLLGFVLAQFPAPVPQFHVRRNNIMGILLKLMSRIPPPKGIRLNVRCPFWEVSGKTEFPSLLAALPNLLPGGCVLYLEGGSPGGKLLDFLLEHRISERAHVAFGTIWPKPTVFHLPATPEVIEPLAELMRSCAYPELAIHFHVYRDQSILLEWHDAFTQPMLLSGELPEQQVRAFAERLRMLFEKGRVEQCAAPNGGPATPLGNSGATEGPPSVS